MSLEEGISLLDSSLMNNSRGMIRPRDRTQRMEMDIENDGDMSLTMLPHEINRFINNTTLGFNDSITRRSSIFDMQSIAESSISAYKGKSDQLFAQFLGILQSRTNDSEIFETVKDLIQALNDTIELVNSSDKHAKYKSNSATDNWMELERDTWKLLYCLYKDRLVTQKLQADYDDMPLVSSERTIVEHIYTTNTNLRQYQLIVDWLEETALERYSTLIGYYTDRTVAWENTLHKLQNIGETVFGTNREMVKSLDPDAPIRERLPLHDLDIEDQNRLLKQIFTKIRQGQFDEAQVLCEHCGQPWRAAVLEGWRLFHDPNYDHDDENMKEAIEGNPNRDIWKKCAWMMAENKQLDEYSRATAGIFCGHIESLQTVLSDSWSDLLWAHLKVQIDIFVESKIRSCSMRSYQQMPDKYWNNKMSLEHIFDELSAHKSITVKATAETAVCIIQKYLILDDVPELMKHIEKWVSGSDITPQMLRFLAHIVLFIRQIGVHHQESIADNVIKCYVECLIKFGDPQLVAFYTAALGNDIQIEMFSKFLETINETDLRRKCLKEAELHGLDIMNITAYTVTKIRNTQDPDDMKQLKGQLSDIDKMKISSLEWLTFYNEQNSELLWQANSVIRTFMAQNKIEGVRQAYKMVPESTLKNIVSYYGSKEDLPAKESCSIKEFLCHQTYLKAIDSYNDWVHNYYNLKPKEPTSTKLKSTFTEKFSAEHKEQTYRADMERWKIKLIQQTKITESFLNNVVLFPERGWLIDPETDKEIDESNKEEWDHRLIQMESLRKIYIPEIILLIHKILSNVGEHQRCIQLVDQLADDNRKLYSVYSKQKLSELMMKVAESSLALMNEHKDSWGYPK